MVFLRPLIRYADFRGRARRSEYWGFFLFQTAIGGLFGGMGTLSLTQADPAAGGTGFLLSLGLAGLTALIFLVPQLAVLVRRLHDTDRSAWWMLLQAPAALAPFAFIGAIAGAMQSPYPSTEAIVSAAAGGLLLVAVACLCNLVLMILLWLPGTPGENRFGPDPRGPDGYGSSSGSGPGVIAEHRLDQLFAEARREGDAAAPDTEPRWKPDLDFGPMNGRPVATPAAAPVARQAATSWPEAPSGPTFGRRRG